MTTQVTGEELSRVHADIILVNYASQFYFVLFWILFCKKHQKPCIARIHIKMSMPQHGIRWDFKQSSGFDAGVKGSKQFTSH